MSKFAILYEKNIKQIKSYYSNAKQYQKAYKAFQTVGVLESSHHGNKFKIGMASMYDKLKALAESVSPAMS